MKVLRVISRGCKPSEAEVAALGRRGIELTAVEISGISALSAVQLARVLDKAEAEVQQVTSIKDAMAAISALKITRAERLPSIELRLPPNAEVPRGVPSEICRKVDVWVFPSERLRGEFEALEGVEMRRVRVEPVEAYDAPETLPEVEQMDKPVMCWMGEILDPERLKRAIQMAVDTDSYLRICGEGKPRWVMPVVRWSRCLDRRDNIVWLGKDYDMAREIAMAESVVQTMADMTEIEAAFVKHGRRLIKLDD